jgi:hypothetical protein
MKPSIQTLGQILYSPSQYIIPVFQRNYRWQEAQWQKLWESLLEIRNPEKKGNHFMGFLVFVPGLAEPGKATTFHLIDGQQRLTTASILLAALRNVARRSGQADLADEIHEDYLVHSRKKGDDHYRLLPKERDYASYVAVVSERGEPTGRVAEALAFFESKLEGVAESDPDGLRSLFDTVAQRFEFMFATLESENAYNIFKSLNSTGVPLGPADLIRNFVFMHVPPDDHDDFDREMWAPLEARFARPDGSLDEERFSKFFRDFLMKGGRYVRAQDTFADFEARYEATGFSPTELAASLTRAAQYHAIINGDAVDADPAVNTALAGLRVLDSSTTYPLLLALFERRAAGRIDSASLARSLDMIRGFIVRRFVCNETSRPYARIFVQAAGKDGESPEEALREFLLERGWPDDRRFERAFAEFPLYGRAYAREIVVALERARRHKEPADLTSAQVEHIMPQTLSDGWRQDLGPEADRVHADWLHRPGNLTLSAYNQELWNHRFSVKREQYAESNIGLTRDLAEYDRWTEAEMTERGRELAAEAARIWIGPKEQYERPASERVGSRIETDLHALRVRFWSALHDILAARFPARALYAINPYGEIYCSSGIPSVKLTLHFGVKRKEVGLNLYFRTEAGLRVWERIRQNPDQFEAPIGAPWRFWQSDTHMTVCITAPRPAADLDDDTTWPGHFEWFAEMISLLDERLAPQLVAGLERGSTE